jgi:hypothetical protein
MIAVPAGMRVRIIFTKEGVTVNSSNRHHPRLTEVTAIEEAVPLIDALWRRLTISELQNSQG